MKRPPWLAPLAFFALVAFLLAPEAATGAGVFGYHDLRHHHLPWRSWAATQWAAGEVPWWASGAGSGFPLLAEGEGGFLYLPTMLLFVLAPDGLALNASVLGHHVLAAMGMWAFVRALGLRHLAPVVAGLGWGFGGFFVSHALYLGMQNGLAWVGWLLFATVTRRWWLTGLGIGMLGLAGHPQGAAFAGLLVGAHALAVLAPGERLRWGAGAVAGLVIASPQLLATAELARHSLRDGGVSGAFASIGAMPIQEMVGFVLPYAFGFDRPADIVETYYHRGSGYWGSGVNSWETCVYVGFPLAVLAVLGLRRSRFWTGALVVAVLLMLGGPAWALVRHLPGFEFFRFPGRFAIVAVAALSVLAAYGFDSLRRLARPAPVRSALVWVVAAFSLTTGFAQLGLQTRRAEVSGWLDRHFQAQLDRPAPPPASSALAAAALPPPEPEVATEIPGKVARILADLERSTDPRSPRVWVPLLLLLTTAASLRRPRLLVAVVALDLLSFGKDYHPTVPTDSVLTSPQWLSRPMTTLGGFRTTVLDRRIDSGLDGTLLSASLGLPLGTSDVIVPSPLLMVRNDALLAAAGLDVGDKGPGKVVKWLAHIDVSRRLGVRWIATMHEIPGLIPLVRGQYFVFDDAQALPRARVVPCVRGVADAESAFAATLAEDPKTTVVVEGGVSGCAEGAAPFAVAATVESYREAEVVLRAVGPGTLVLADTNYPGWTSTVDGVATPIAQADLVMRAVPLGPGDHEVRFGYDPGWAGRALWAAAGVALACVGVGLRRGR